MPAQEIGFNHTVVPSYLWEIGSKTPNSCLNLFIFLLLEYSLYLCLSEFVTICL